MIFKNPFSLYFFLCIIYNSYVILGAALVFPSTETFTWQAGSGAMCSPKACNNEAGYHTWSSSYACSDNNGEWNEGKKSLKNILPVKPGHTNLINQINATFLGQFNCLIDANHTSQVTGTVNGHTIFSYEQTFNASTLWECKICGNCGRKLFIPGLIYPKGLPDFKEENLLEILVEQNVICLHSMNLTFSYEVVTTPVDYDTTWPSWLYGVVIGGSVFVCVAFTGILAMLIKKARTKTSYKSLQSRMEQNPNAEEDIQIIERIGRGSMGLVYRAFWNGSEVAVKKLPMENSSASLIEEILTEANLMSGLRHPNILMYMGCCMNPPDVCIITEYMSQGSLYKILHDEKVDLTWDLKRKMLLDAAKGMTYLHNRQPSILHRDLKSANLLVDENWKVKVCDFGLSKLMDSWAGTMTACGTPCWVAPEVLRNQHYTEKADVYSFGIVMWEVLTRDQPFDGMPPFRVVFLVGTQGARPDIPECKYPEFISLMEDCWTENPEERPSFSEVQERITEFNFAEPTDPRSIVSSPSNSIDFRGVMASQDFSLNSVKGDSGKLSLPASESSSFAGASVDYNYYNSFEKKENEKKDTTE